MFRCPRKAGWAAKDLDPEGEAFDLFQKRIGLLPFAMTALQMRNALRILGYGKTDKILDYLARNW